MVPKSRILILTGPSGCGKISLIRTYSLNENKVVKYYVDIKPSYVEDLGSNYDPGTIMPDDLVGLITYIKEISVGASAKAGVELKRTGFSSHKPIQIPQMAVVSDETQQKGSLFVVRGLPECLKLSSVH